MTNQALSTKTYPDWLSDIVAGYLRKMSHRGQLRLLGGFERLVGSRRWNVKTNRGFRIAVDRRDCVQWAILKHAEWDSEVAQALSERWTPDDVFYDIGANIGYFSLHALAEDLRHVVGFEPFDELAALMASNLQNNKFSEYRYRIEKLALGTKSEMLAYLPGSLENSGAGKLARVEVGDAVKVNVASLDEYIAKPGSPLPTVMKLDVEGFEREVLEGARNLLTTNPPHTIVFEADCDSNHEIKDPSLTEILTDAGYRIIHLPREVSESKENYLAIHSGK